MKPTPVFSTDCLLAIVVYVRTVWALITTLASHHLPVLIPRPLPTCHKQWMTVQSHAFWGDAEFSHFPGQKQ